MIKLFAKPKQELTASEIQQLELIIKRYYKGAKQEFIDRRLRTGPDFDIVLQKKEDEILAASYYHHTKADTPFAKNTHIVHFSISVKKQGHRGNVIWQNGRFYARKNFGAAWMLKKAVGISAICNPKVLENFVLLFRFNYPYSVNNNEKKVIEFLNAYFMSRKVDIHLDKNFCFMDHTIQKTDITEEYDRYYRSKNEQINELFFVLDILTRENGRIYLTGKHMVICGYRNPFDWWKRVK
jgi:hypothetical protein